jgi:hypothetical protein
MVGKAMPHAGKNTAYKKSGSTIIAIDAPAHGLSSGKEFNIPIYAEFIHVLFQKFKPKYLIGHLCETCLYYQSVYQNNDLKNSSIRISK